MRNSISLWMIWISFYKIISKKIIWSKSFMWLSGKIDGKRLLNWFGCPSFIFLYGVFGKNWKVGKKIEKNLEFKPHLISFVWLYLFNLRVRLKHPKFRNLLWKPPNVTKFRKYFWFNTFKNSNQYHAKYLKLLFQHPKSIC